MIMGRVTQIVEGILYVCVVVFPVTTYLLIRTVKQENLKLIEDAVTNPMLPNLDLKFFPSLQREYTRITGNRLLAIINKLSFYSGLSGFILLFALVVIHEMLSS
jgi:hypothetical protein